MEIINSMDCTLSKWLPKPFCAAGKWYSVYLWRMEGSLHQLAQVSGVLLTCGMKKFNWFWSASTFLLLLFLIPFFFHGCHVGGHDDDLLRVAYPHAWPLPGNSP